MDTDCILREWRLSDVASLAKNANNIHVWNNVRDYFPHPYSEEDGKQYIEAVLSKPCPATDMAIVVDGKVAGGIGIVSNSDVERISAELGYWLGEKYWNRGIMTEAIKEMSAHAFTRFPLRKIYAPVFDFNIASQRVLQKAGFEREAVLKQAAVKNGNIIDLHYYSLLKSRWAAGVRHRLYDESDFPLLEALLYEAIFQPEGAAPLPRDIIQKPEINLYIRDFGKKQGDFCLLAELNGKTVGGAWLRVPDGETKGFGHVAPGIPELAIAVFEKYRGMGIGTGLMHNLTDIIFNSSGYKQISLSVTKANPAVRLYKKLGFEIVKENEKDYLMLLESPSV
jgi:RimJ/RimL family protein N-acetyltransferase